MHRKCTGAKHSTESADSAQIFGKIKTPIVMGARRRRKLTQDTLVDGFCEQEYSHGADYCPCLGATVEIESSMVNDCQAKNITCGSSKSSQGFH